MSMKPGESMSRRLIRQHRHLSQDDIGEVLEGHGSMFVFRLDDGQGKRFDIFLTTAAPR